jgi:hypothetical protein
MKMLACALLACGLVAASDGSALAVDAHAQQTQLAALSGDCNVDLGVALVAASAEGYPALPLNELLPGYDWVYFMHPAVATLSFKHPPGWIPQPFAQIGTAGVRVVSPDGSAAFEIFNTTNVAGISGAQQVAEQGLISLIGQGTQASFVCGYDFAVPGAVPTTAVFEAIATQTSYAAAVGTVFHDLATGAPIAIDHRAIIGPRQHFAALVRGVFLPVFTQFMQSSGGTERDRDAERRKTEEAIKKGEEAIKNAQEGEGG